MARKKTNTVRETVVSAENTGVLDIVKTLKAPNVVDELAKLQLKVQDQFSNITGSITNELARLNQVQTAITLQEQRLKELFQIESEAVSLDDLKAQREQWRSDWDAEQARLEQERERDDQEYQYELNRVRKAAEDKYNETVARTKRDETLRAEQLNTEWAKRETVLKLAEQELVDLRAQIVAMPETIRKEVSKAEAIRENSLNREHKHALEMLNQTHTSEKTVMKANIDSLNMTITHLREHVTGLDTQLAEARRDSKEVAQKALESASSRDLATNLQRALESRDNSTSGQKR
jgi:hypothetical protein